MFTEFQHFDPAEFATSGQNLIPATLFDSLTAISIDGKLEGGLAQSWEPSSDGRTWTFKLRPGVKFHDGEAVNAAAVKFAFDRLLTSDPPARRRSFFAPFITDTRVVDDGTVEFLLPERYGLLPFLLSSPFAGIPSPRAVTATGEDFGRTPVGTGPFAFEMLGSQELVLKRNDAYWGERPPLDRIVFQVVAEDATRIALLERGDIDLAQRVPPSEASRIAEHAEITVVEADALEAREFRLNVLLDKFKDVRVRRALNHALDVPQIVATVLGGAGTYTGGPLPAGVLGAVTGARYSYDPALARRLLAEAGYPDGFETSLPLAASSQELAEAIQSQWREIGVRLQLNLLESAARASIHDAGPEGTEKEMVNQAIGLQYPDADRLLHTFHSSQWSPDGGNRGFYRNERYDQVFDRALSEPDVSRRAELYKEAQEILIDDVPSIFLYTSKYQYGLRRSVLNLALDSRELIDFRRVAKAQ